MLPSATLRKPITSITAILLPFVTYLLTLSLSLIAEDVTLRGEATSAENVETCITSDKRQGH
jgi:hypothetical protein